MTTNESSLDRVIRVVLAGVVLLVVAGVLLVTAATGFCPLYRVLGINTCRIPTQR